MKFGGLFCNDPIAKLEVMFLLIAEIKQLCNFSPKCFEESSFTITTVVRSKPVNTDTDGATESVCSFFQPLTWTSEGKFVNSTGKSTFY